MPMPARIAARLSVISHLAVDQDLARIGLVEAVEDRHQRRLAGAVLADDAVDRALADADVDVLVGLDRAERLGDAAKLDGGNGGVPAVPLSPSALIARAASEDRDRAGRVGHVVVHLDLAGDDRASASSIAARISSVIRSSLCSSSAQPTPPAARSITWMPVSSSGPRTSRRRRRCPRA
jgi:hypothetical protein